ncbi:MFS transporter [Bordetella genomosp. 10]|uniref:MFS transporter n=1 Tax=Bordetella genomosp. 10 TaxID=1416804 RepID=A0A261S0C3_9BORD|nr:MFS transporter [Bordetella genomosp. 10]OZI30794.1 MFS transporter [Bordetella genomosp. 10]
MKFSAARARALTLRHLRKDFFPWAIALAVGIDYFDNTLFGTFTSYIAGGINASPDELVWSSTAYATASVLGIVQQQWLAERLGYRRYLSICLLMFALGSLAASLSESSLELALARGFQGYFIGPMLGTCRIMLQMCFTPQQRPVATRIFLLNILVASASAPLIGGYLVAYFDWRALFIFPTIVGAILAAFAFLIVPHVGKLRPELRSATHLWPYLVFACALGGLQIVAQQVRFEIFSSSPMFTLLTVAGVAALVWVARQQWRHPRPLLRLHALREGPYRMGMLLYSCYYMLTNAIGYLVARMIQGGYGYPVENAGRLMGLTSFGSVVMALLYFRYAKLVPSKKLLIVPGFVMAAAVCLWMSLLPPDASTGWLLPPLIVRGFLLMFIALPTASVAFQIFSNDEFNHGYRFKNIVKQLSYSLSTAVVIILEQHRIAVHQTTLTEFANPSNPVFNTTAQTMVRTFEGRGYDPATAGHLVLEWLNGVIAHQATFLSLLDGFDVMIVLAIIAGLLAMLQRQIR